MLKMSLSNYLILNIIGKTETFLRMMNCEHNIEGKFWGKNKLKLLPTDEAFKRLVWVVSKMDNARKKYVNTRGYLVVIFLHCLTQLKEIWGRYWKYN